MIEIVQERRPGAPKMKKPKELTGRAAIMSYKWGGVRSCPVFRAGDDLWIHHRDWCSIVLYGQPEKRPTKFAYNDNFAADTIPGEAWIRLKGIFKFERRTDALRLITEECLIRNGSRFCSDDHRMFQDVYMACCGDR